MLRLSRDRYPKAVQELHTDEREHKKDRDHCQGLGFHAKSSLRRVWLLMGKCAGIGRKIEAMRIAVSTTLGGGTRLGSPTTQR